MILIIGEMTIRERWENVRGRIRQAAVKAGRDPDEIVLVAVSKGFGHETVDEACRSGMTCFGENKVQEARQKMPLCSGSIEWHMIGHIQSNKVRDVVRMFSMAHSVDSFELLTKMDEEAGAAGKIMPVCLQVNVSGERAISGGSEGFAKTVQREKCR